ncbi:hypothetical protein HZS_2386 [Henneguya salminicola]|nr:hypothetical protein HZS_2386 [Henneguya salminicola]
MVKKKWNNFFSDEHGNALTHICCRLGLIDIVKLLIEKGVNFNSCTNSEDTALHCAVQSNNEEIVDLLIPLPILLDEQNCLGNSPLHYACFLSNKNIALKLLKSGCNISTRNKFNQTPLDLSPLDMAEELASQLN